MSQGCLFEGRAVVNTVSAVECPGLDKGTESLSLMSSPVRQQNLLRLGALPPTSGALRRWEREPEPGLVFSHLRSDSQRRQA